MHRADEGQRVRRGAFGGVHDAVGVGAETEMIKPGQGDDLPLISRKKIKQLGKDVPPELAGCNCFTE
ncbi:hypothetical protein V4F39_26790 [Aquincola sp. MAHUQ-54]|uniref:Uncharacterized protein n=1 Tax=Aquincola agrisoli TaxID=3119538 RepID=A0AAW9QCG6_9BURK